MLSTNAIAGVKVMRVGNRSMPDDDFLAVEEPLEIQLAWDFGDNSILKSIAVTMRTPGNDEELAAGFLFTEGILKTRNQLLRVSPSSLGCNTIVVQLLKDSKPLLQQAQRNFYTTSSCGVCGKTSIEAIKTVSLYAKHTPQIYVDEKVFGKLPVILRQQQLLFNSTGGLHASALFDLNGSFLMLREDVGRHNALDKIIGSAFLADELPLANHILLLSGRASFELVQKAAMAGIQIVAAIGAPSSLAVQLAEEAGITLIGFLRNDGFNIYSGKTRVALYERFGKG